MQSSLALIPKPESVQVHPGSCRLLPGSAIAAPPEGRQAAQLLERVTGFARAVEGAAIRLVIDPAVPGEEAYRLDVSSDGVRIAASTPAGLFYGAQTLRQLLPPGAERKGITQPVDLPCLSIADRPRFAYRGFMLDASRHFFAPAEIKRLLDLLALQKINRFHWHLTDDQGWRIQIQQYPRLTEVGAARKQTQVGGWAWGKPRFDEQPYGGFYTQDEVREIVAYARENFIEVIPEINAPGHAAAAIAAYPQLACSGQPAEVQASFAR
jgi:hexosaminidase